MRAEHGKPRRRDGRRREAGFTLLEALVAFAIAAVALAALLQGSLTGLRASQLAGRHAEALARARSRLAVLEAAPVSAGDLQGEDGGGYHWRVRIVPVATAETAGDRPMTDHGRPARLSLYAVTVIVGWREGGRAREVRLETRRLGPAAADPP